MQCPSHAFLFTQQIRIWQYRHTNLIVKFLNCLGDLKEKIWKLLQWPNYVKVRATNKWLAKKINTKQVARTQQYYEKQPWKGQKPQLKKEENTKSYTPMTRVGSKQVSNKQVNKVTEKQASKWCWNCLSQTSK